MIKDITIGQYIYGNSPLHRMNPAVKIVLTLAFAAAVLMLKTPVQYFIYAALTAAAVVISGVPFKMLFKGLKPILWIITFTSVFNLFQTPGRVIIEFKIFSLTPDITAQGVVLCVLLALRLILLVFGTSLLTLTTAPLQLTDGIERLLSPLKIVKLPSHEIAMMMTIAIRFIPTIGEEAQKIMKAQKARGADFENGNIIKRSRAMLPVIIPLLTGVFKRADELALAMDARCYRGGEGRTKMKENPVGKTDFAVAAVFAAACAAAVLGKFIFC